MDLFRLIDDVWTFHRRVLVVDAFGHAQLGARVVMRLPWLAIGSPEDDFGAANAGSAWLLRLNDAGTDFQPVRRLPRAPLGPSVAGEKHSTGLAIAGDATQADVFVGAPFAPSPEAPGTGLVREYLVQVVDCDGDGFDDGCEISLGFATDSNGDGVPDVCESTADLDGDGQVGAGDLALLLANWGTAGSGDLDGDGVVGGADLGRLLAAWGVVARVL